MVFPILGGNSVLEATPLVVDGVMYTTGSGNPATVTAIDAARAAKSGDGRGRNGWSTPTRSIPTAEGWRFPATGFSSARWTRPDCSGRETGRPLWESRSRTPWRVTA